MSINIESAFEDLREAGTLPSPSGVGLQVLLLTQRDDCTTEEVVEVLRGDPALTAAVLRLANSAAYDTAHQVGNLRDAASLLGFRQLRSAALGFSLLSGNRRGNCTAFDYEAYWTWSISAAVAARAFAEELTGIEPLDAFTCALLSRIGRLALATVHPLPYAKILNSLGSAPGSLESRESAAFAISNLEVSAALLDEWRLPSYYSDVLKAIGAGATPTLDEAAAYQLFQLLQLGQATAELIVASEADQPIYWAKLCELAQTNELSPSDLQVVWSKVEPEVRDWCKLLEVELGPVLGYVDLEDRAARIQSDKAVQGANFHAASAAPLRPADTRTTRILAVDDDPVSLRVLVRHLEREGYDVVTAENGREALRMVVEADPQIVVTDWMMPEIDGLELCQRLRARSDGHRLYILILTGQAEEDHVVKAFDAGADDYVTKPFKPKLLLARIRGGQRVVELQRQVEEDKKELREKNARQAVMARKLRVAAMTDALTNLPNRRYVMKKLETEWLRTGEEPMSVIMLDIDKFKLVNDNYGHDVGDAVLRETATAIRSVLRRGDDCARMGGEEFLILSPGTGLESALHLAERVRAKVESTVVRFSNFEGNVTISLGVAERQEGMRNVDELLKVADEAVYLAKHGGRNRVLPGSFQPGRRSA
ncbi:MAG: diguanylate cyclase [Planctomycetota bacterium]